MSIVAWIIVGGLAGWLAGRVMGSNDNQGCITNIILGVVGAFVGGWVLNFVGIGGAVTGINIPSIVTAFVGALVVLFIKSKL